MEDINKTIKVKTHIDGVWNTSEYEYKGWRIEIKSAENKGMKSHAWEPDSIKPKFTLRFFFIYPEQLLKKTKDKIDSILSTTPIKTINQ